MTPHFFLSLATMAVSVLNYIVTLKIKAALAESTKREREWAETEFLRKETFEAHVGALQGR